MTYKRLLIFILSFQVVVTSTIAAVNDELFLLEWTPPTKANVIIPQTLHPYLVLSENKAVKKFELTWAQYLTLDDTISALEGHKLLRLKIDDSPTDKTPYCPSWKRIFPYFFN